MHPGYSKLSGFISLFMVQIIFLVVYWVFVRYDVEALPKDDAQQQPETEGNGLKEEHVSKYPREYYHWNSFDGIKAFKKLSSYPVILVPSSKSPSSDTFLELEYSDYAIDRHT